MVQRLEDIDQRRCFMRLREQRVRHRADGQRRHDDIDRRAERHRSDDADGEIALRILRLLRGGRYGIEAIKREEHDGCGTEHAIVPAVCGLCRAIAERREWREMRRVERLHRQHHEQHQRRQLDEHQHDVERRAFARAQYQQQRHDTRDDDGGKVDKSAGCDAVQKCRGHRPSGGCDERLGMSRPADGNGRGGHGVFEHQTPADDPGDHLAQHRVAVGVGAARDRDHRRHLGIAERRAGADHAADQERDDNGRARKPRADAGQGVDAGADDGADADGDEMGPAQRLLEAMRAFERDTGFDGLPARDGAHAELPLLAGTLADRARIRATVLSLTIGG